jgi:hypothetical protein
MSPDWSIKIEPIPYAKLSNPQSMNLYAYVKNNPFNQTDPDGHSAYSDWAEQNDHDLIESGNFVSNSQPNLGNEQGGQNMAQEQGSSTGVGFWTGVGQRFKNWLKGGEFKTNEQLDREAEFITFTLSFPSLVDQNGTGIATVTDYGAFASFALKKPKLGTASTLVNLISDPSAENFAMNAVTMLIPKVIERSELPITIGFAAWDGSQFAGSIVTSVATPDAPQAATINANGFSMANPANEDWQGFVPPN